jgi:stress response protein YsnF
MNEDRTRPPNAPDATERTATAELPATGTVLGLEGRVERSETGWLLRLPLRAEQVTIEREAFVVEEIAVGRVAHRETVQLEDTVRIEKLETEMTGDVAHSRGHRIGSADDRTEP